MLRSSVDGCGTTFIASTVPCDCRPRRISLLPQPGGFEGIGSFAEISPTNGHPRTDALPRARGVRLDQQRRVVELVRFPARSTRERRVDDPDAGTYWIGKRNPLAGPRALSVSLAVLHTTSIDPQRFRLKRSKRCWTDVTVGRRAPGAPSRSSG